MRALFFCFVLALFAIGCQRPPKYPDAPTIKFESITSTPIMDTSGNITSSEIEIKLYFTDGTGDLGLTQDDTAGIYQDVIETRRSDTAKKYSRNYVNYWVDAYIKKDGDYTLIKSPDDYHKNSSNFYIYDDRFRPFNDQYLTNSSPIEGYLNYKFTVLEVLDESTVTYRPLLTKGDSMRFEIRILDRKLNISNKVTTADIVILSP